MNKSDAPKTHILTVNAGSSSIKLALFTAHDLRKVFEMAAQNIGQPSARLITSDGSKVVDLKNHAEAAALLLEQVPAQATISAVGHRIVHGGPQYHTAQAATNSVIKELRTLAAFDPEHLPAQLDLVEALQKILPDTLQILCFDTAFHHDLPARARLLPIPRHFEAKGIRRYGFHGLSYAYIAQELRRVEGVAAANGKVIVAHLGSGASVAALHHGKSIDTTMSMTPTSGIPMSTRSGDLDPGLALYFATTEGYTAERFSHMVNFESGLLGMSGQTADMEKLLELEEHDIHAQETVDLFCYNVTKTIGAFAAALGGLNTVVFTGGMGENAPKIRTRICAGLEFLGVVLDKERNQQNTRLISADGASVGIHVIHTDEAVMIAQETSKAVDRGDSMNQQPLNDTALQAIDAYWRAANYLSVGQIYLCDNPLLKKPLELTHVKKLLLGHWGTTPGQNFIYAHLNRIINANDLSMLYVSGPGHGGPALVSNTYLEGTFSEYYPEVPQTMAGLKKLFQMFSFPYGLSSHVSPQVPGSIHEGGELGYSLSHSFGAVFDNPDLIAACIVGDGEAETGPLATAWHSNKFLNPITDGAVLPILHLNGYKISNPTILARIEHEELEQLLRGYGWDPYFVEGDDPMSMHQLMATALDTAVQEIKRIQTNARTNGDASRPRWPMLVLNSPKGWTGPKTIDGKQIEGNFRSHQVPLAVDESCPDNVGVLEDWLKSYRPETLFDEHGALLPELAALAPRGNRRMGANPHTNGGGFLRELNLPDFRSYEVQFPNRSATVEGNTHALGPYLRDVIKQNETHHNFRIFGPDELVSNRLEAVFEATNRQWEARTKDADEFLATSGAVLDSMLSEHQAEGWLEGYLLTGRHGLLHSYEAFIRIVDSMVNQHAKWIKMSNELPWRKPIASLNYLLTSHVWRQDHNGFTHQDPGFIDHLLNKKASVVRIYLPPDANTLLSTMDHCLKSRNYINLTITGKHTSPQWLNMEEAIEHCTKGIGIWDWASNDDSEPDVVMACAGDVPTLETLAAVSLLRKYLPALKIRVINIVDLLRLEPDTEHPHGLSDADYDSIFTKDKEIIFAFHGYPWVIHRLTYRRTNRNMHVRGYKEEGTITTAFDMTVRNDMDRFHLVMDVIERTGSTSSEALALKQLMEQKLIEHSEYIRTNGVDMPEVRDWIWPK